MQQFNLVDACLDDRLPRVYKGMLSKDSLDKALMCNAVSGLDELKSCMLSSIPLQASCAHHRPVKNSSQGHFNVSENLCQLMMQASSFHCLD